MWALHRSVAKDELHDAYVNDAVRIQKQSDKMASLGVLKAELAELKAKQKQAAEARAAQQAAAQAVKDQVATAKAEQVAVANARSKMREQLAAVNAANAAKLEAVVGHPDKIPAIKPLAEDQDRLMEALLAVAEKRAACSNGRASAAAAIAEQATKAARDIRDVDMQIADLDTAILNGRDELFREQRDMREVHLDDAARRSLREINSEIFARSQPLLAELTAMDDELATAKEQIRDLCLENYNIKLWLNKRFDAGITLAELHRRLSEEEKSLFATKARLEQSQFDLQRVEEDSTDVAAFVRDAEITYQQVVALHTTVESMAGRALKPDDDDDDYGKPLPGIYRLPTTPSPTKQRSAVPAYRRVSPGRKVKGDGDDEAAVVAASNVGTSTFLPGAHKRSVVAGRLRRGTSQNGMGSAPSRINQMGTMIVNSAAQPALKAAGAGRQAIVTGRNNNNHVDFDAKYTISLSDSDSDDGSEYGLLAAAKLASSAASSRRSNGRATGGGSGRRSPSGGGSANDRSKLQSRPSLSELANESQVDRAISEGGIWKQWFEPPTQAGTT